MTDPSAHYPRTGGPVDSVLCACGGYQYDRWTFPEQGLPPDFWQHALAGVTVGDAGLDAALGKYVLHSLDGHDECGPDCEIGALRLALPDAAYAATISHGDIEAALAAPPPPRIDPERLARALRKACPWHMNRTDVLCATAILDALAADEGSAT